MSEYKSMSITNPDLKGLSKFQMTGLLLTGYALVVLLLSCFNVSYFNSVLGGGSVITALVLGPVFFAIPLYYKHSKGVKNNGIYHQSISSKGILAWVTGIVLTLFYVLLYWYPEKLGLGVDGSDNKGLIAFFDPISNFIRSKPANQWFVYGTLYTVVILGLGIKFMLKYRGNKYQIRRTIVVTLSQLLLAYLIPEILTALEWNDVSKGGEYLGYYDMDFKNMWPLDHDFFYGWHLDAMQHKAYQPLGMIYLVWGIVLFLVVTPILTYYFGKRWYCSWICGCGGLAETAGDAFRQHSSKKLSAWKLERWLIHLVMVFVFLMTVATLYGYFSGASSFLGLDIYGYFQRPYGFLIGGMFSGIIGVGFYPILGSRIWCRFGCPLAGYMGLIQRFKSRFRITTNGGQCISCGNCSTYCEQGIDVRAYAQKGQNIVRSSCVGCGICSAVCPRGVLKLENAPNDDYSRTHASEVVLGNKGILDWVEKNA